MDKDYKYFRDVWRFDLNTEDWVKLKTVNNPYKSGIAYHAACLVLQPKNVSSTFLHSKIAR